MSARTTQSTPALTQDQRQDIALCAKALADTRAIPANRAQLALTEVRTALEIALRVIGQIADSTA